MSRFGWAALAALIMVLVMRYGFGLHMEVPR